MSGSVQLSSAEKKSVRVFKLDRKISADYVRRLFDYRPETGLFYWREQRSWKTPSGSTAGNVARDGYVRVKIDSQPVLAHRLAWLYMTGAWPADEIDHRDLCRTNNRWENLRVASHGQNQSNTRTYRNNRTGLKGARLDARSGKYYAVIVKGSVQTHLGTYQTAQEAHAAYAVAAKQIHGEFGRLS